MPRDLVLGNGSLLICQDRNLFIRDLYWPRVGLFNHLSGRSIRFGLWSEGQFTWVEETWNRDLRYKPDSMVTDCRLKTERFNLTLSVSDAVDPEANVFVRRITITDHSGKARQVRIFWAADTVLCETDIGDTAYYDPFCDSVIHYKRDNYLLFSGLSSDGSGVRDFACGMKGVAGMEGTWKDAEDGDLSNNPIAQGAVDSAISIIVDVPANGTSDPAYLWIAAASNRDAILDISARIRQETPETLLVRAETAERAWLSAAVDRSGIGSELAELPSRVRRLYRQSLHFIRTQCDRGGAILAANDTDIMRSNKAHYSYMWPRDGALIAHTLDSAGCHDLSRQFFRFCQQILPRDRPAFMQKYGPDGSVGATWHSFIAPNGEPEIPLQEDETALVVWALENHLNYRRDDAEEMYQSLARPCADFLLAYRDPTTHLPLPSWDIWEERRGIHTFTVCTIIAGLRAASLLAKRLGDAENGARYTQGATEVQRALENHLWSETEKRFMRRLEVHADGTTAFDRIVDSSLHALHLFDILPPDDPRVLATLEQVDSRLRVRAGIGGMARYEGDYYGRISHDLVNVPGNPWILCSLWHAQWEIARAKTMADLETAADTLSWAEICSLPSGVLPEQIHPYNFTPITVAPLTWSHSEFVETVLKWIAKRREITG